MRNLLVGLAIAGAVIASFLVSAGGGGKPDAEVADTGTAVATFAGGCFWCTESDFEKLPGVADAVSGYTGGKEVNPSYKEVSSGATGHLESVQVHYDPDQIRYETLLEAFWRMIDPTDAGGQFVDRGQDPLHRSGGGVAERLAQLLGGGGGLDLGGEVPVGVDRPLGRTGRAAREQDRRRGPGLGEGPVGLSHAGRRHGVVLVPAVNQDQG